jgi:hypothetical protein
LAKYDTVSNPEEDYMSSQKELMTFFVDFGDRFIQKHLRYFDIARMKKKDDLYAMKVFLGSYAFARAGAPRGYPIAAIKSVSYVESGRASEGSLWSVFKDFYGGKKIKNAMPVQDHRLMKTDFPHVVRSISEGRVEEAFSRLDFEGVGHKIKSMFIRDMVYLTEAKPRTERTIDWYLYAQPIDVWVRKTAGLLLQKDGARPLEYDKEHSLKPSDFGMNKSDFQIATRIIAACLRENLSPLKLNMGIWYYCSRVVADAARLRTILKERSVKVLRDELGLIQEFLPKLS